MALASLGEAFAVPGAPAARVPALGAVRARRLVNAVRVYDASQLRYALNAAQPWTLHVGDAAVLLVDPAVGGTTGGIALTDIAAVSSSPGPAGGHILLLQFLLAPGQRRSVELWPGDQSEPVAPVIVAAMAQAWRAAAPAGPSPIPDAARRLQALALQPAAGGFSADAVAAGLPVTTPAAPGQSGQSVPTGPPAQSGPSGPLPGFQVRRHPRAATDAAAATSRPMGTATPPPGIQTITTPARPASRRLWSLIVAAVLAVTIIAGAGIGVAVRLMQRPEPAAAPAPSAVGPPPAGSSLAASTDTATDATHITCPASYDLAWVIYFGRSEWAIVCAGAATYHLAMWTTDWGLQQWDDCLRWDADTFTTPDAAASVVVGGSTGLQVSYIARSTGVLMTAPGSADPPTATGDYVPVGTPTHQLPAFAGTYTAGQPTAAPTAQPTDGVGAYGVPLPQADPADQARYLSQILARSAEARSQLQTGIELVNSCQPASLQDGKGIIDAVTQNRRDLIIAVQQAPVDALPDGDQVVSQLLSALEYSLQADQAYQDWAGAVISHGCGAGEDARQRGTDASELAGAAKRTFCETWNTTIAPQYNVDSVTREQI